MASASTHATAWPEANKRTRFSHTTQQTLKRCTMALEPKMPLSEMKWEGGGG